MKFSSTSYYYHPALLAIALFLLTACGGGGSSSSSPSSNNPNMWAWMGGSNVINQPGVYGTLGVTDAANMPGRRDSAVSWMDNNGKLWLFGGAEHDTKSDRNDLWQFDGTNWTWMGGSKLVSQAGFYGTLNVADANNMPGARFGAVSWTDNSGKMWLFGGAGSDTNGTAGHLNDLWRFDGSQWTWVGGSNVVDQQGVYGTTGTADAANIPGGRVGAVRWIDSNGKLWLFGGYGYDSAGTLDLINDLWQFDGSNWTWMSGSDVVNQSGSYGTLGVANTNNVPGARYYAVSWTDGSGKLWLFGGYGYDSTGAWGELNDLWQFDGSSWTWMGGSKVVNQIGVYGTLGVAGTANTPGARDNAVGWTDNNGMLWLFGGWGYSSSAAGSGYLNDLWKFDGTNWIWMGGNDVINQAGVYGTQGTADAASIPGGRNYATNWTNSSGKLWLFGGAGLASGTTQDGGLNDLWSYQP